MMEKKKKFESQTFWETRKIIESKAFVKLRGDTEAGQVRKKLSRVCLDSYIIRSRKIRVFDKILSLKAAEFFFYRKKTVIYGQVVIISLYSYRQIDRLKSSQNNTRLDKYNSERYKLKGSENKEYQKKK